jgi:hypothetical protein
MDSTSLITDLGRVAGLVVLLLIVGGLLAVYADSLRRKNEVGLDPTIDADLRHRIEALRHPEHQRHRP